MTHNTNRATSGVGDPSGPYWQRRLRSALTTQPKKTAALLAVLAAMVGKVVLSGGRPARASGSVSSVVRPGSGAAIGTDGSEGAMAATAAASGRAAVVLAALQKWSDASVPPVSRNLFA